MSNHGVSSSDFDQIDAEKRMNDSARQLDNDVIPTLDKMEDETKADEKEENDLVEKVKKKKNDFREDVIQNFNMSGESLITEVTKSKLSSKVVPMFEPEMKILESIKKSVGKIQFREINVQKIYSFRSKIDATCMTAASSNMAWVMDCVKPTLYLYNVKGEVIKSVLIRLSGGINDMAFTQSGDMIVTCGDQKVKSVSENGEEKSTLIDTAPFGCDSVCVTNKQEIVVCMRGNDDQNHVAVYSPDGRSKLREIRGRDGQGEHLITFPKLVVFNGKDLCVVTQGSNIVCVDVRDNVRWVYDGKQARLEKSFDPRGICVDKYNNLLVTDCSNHCVHYIDRDGGLIQVILTQEQTGLEYPWGICVDDSTGSVWVGNSRGNVVIANYL